MSIIDLSHTLGDAVRTYKGLPPVHVCDYLSRKDSEKHYTDGSSFQLDKVELVGNSGTYIDSPFHRFADKKDLAEIALETTVRVPGLVVRAPAPGHWQSIDADLFKNKDLEGKAVLFDTGWSKFYNSEAYYDGHPFLTEGAAIALRNGGVKIVGIDSHNIDDTRDGKRPVHTILLGNDIPIVEHLTNLNALPDQGFSFTAAPIKFVGVGTFPTRAYAEIS